LEPPGANDKNHRRSVVEDQHRVPPRVGGPGGSMTELKDLLVKRFTALGDSLQTLWSVRKDRAQLAVRRRIQTVSMLAAASVAGAAVIIYASVLLVGGTAAGLARLFGSRAWLGDLVAGVLFLLFVIGGLALAIWRSNRSQLRKQREKYAELHRKRQRTGAPN
jgi:hypothetical protein